MSDIGRPFRNQRTSAVGTLNAAGGLTLTVRNSAGLVWSVRQIGVQVAGSVLEPVCRTFIGENDQGVYVSQTFTGSDDTDSTPNVDLHVGDAISAVWEGGTPGAAATLTVIYDELTD